MSVQRYKRKEDGATVYRGIYTSPTGERLTAKKIVVPATAAKRDHERASVKVRDAANVARASVESGTWAPPLPPTPSYTFNQLASKFLTEHRTRRGQLAKDNAFYVERVKVWQREFGTRLASSITREEIEKVVHRSLVGDSTRRKNLRTLGTVLRWSVERGFLMVDPSAKVARPSEPRHRVAFLSDEDEAALLKVCSAPLSRVVRFAIGTGMDREELVQLAWSQVDDNALHAPRAKTGIDRVIPINTQLRQVLEECKRGMRSTSGRVFLRANGQPWTVSALKCAVKRAYARAGLSVSGPFKIFRHTFGTRLAGTGASQVVVRDLMGHTNTATTDKYTHAYAEHLKAAMKALERERA